MFRWLLLAVMPLFILAGCGDLEPEMQDTRTVNLNMDFHGKSSSRSSSSVSASELSQYNTHLILALPSGEVLTSNYRNFQNSFAQGLMNTADKKVSLEIPLNTQMKIFAFLFEENYSMSELFPGTREIEDDVGYYGESQTFEIGTQTNNLSLGVTLIQVAGTGTHDTTAPTASVIAATITTSGNAVVQSTETGTAYLVKTTVSVSDVITNNTVPPDSQWNSVTISSANFNTNLPATGLENGTYKVYAVDTAGNISIASINSVTVVDNITISSSASDNASVAFGQSYQYQLATSGTYSGTITYSLSNHPDGMTISSSGLVEWTPNKASQITTHSNITITFTTASGYALTQTYDLTVTGTCAPGNVLGLWSGDQRTSTDSTKYLGNISAYTDNASSGDVCGANGDKDCTATNNYYKHNNSVDLTHGPTPTATTGNVFFYNQYDNTTHLYLFYMFGVKNNSSAADTIKIDIFTDNNSSTDDVVVADDNSNEIDIQSSGCGSSATCYKGRHSYNSGKTDGGVIGPFSGTNFRIFVDFGGTSTIDGSSTLTLGNLVSFKYYSKDGSPITLGGAEDNFTFGYKTSIDCSN